MSPLSCPPWEHKVDEDEILKSRPQVGRVRNNMSYDVGGLGLAGEKSGKRKRYLYIGIAAIVVVIIIVAAWALMMRR